MKNCCFVIRCSLLILVLSVTAKAQIGSLTPMVIGSVGGFSGGGSSFSLSFSVGEPVITTANASNLILTQGFEQPSPLAPGGLQFTLVGAGITCQGADDGTATPQILSGTLPFTYSWSTNPVQTTQTATHLGPGNYVCTVKDGAGHLKTDSVIVKDNNNICGIHVYSGFSPNGDGKNDIWIIDNIELMTPNQVSVFDRWGDKVWTITNYDNAVSVFKGNDMQGKVLPDGTYFYVIRMGNKEQKGWVEISR
jgi:gliding motility-associated-like protein